MVTDQPVALLYVPRERRAYVVGATVLARSHLGLGVVSYVHDDGYVGVELTAGRTDEIPADQCVMGGVL